MADTTQANSRPDRPLALPPLPEFVAMMAGMMALTALSIDIMLPALGLIQHDYAIADENSRQLVVIVFFIGFSVGQVFFGPISDRIGRKPVLLGGMIVYALATVLCLLSGSFAMLLLARALQGVACAAPRIMAVAVVRDGYQGRRMAEVMSFIIMVFIMVPVLAPMVGSGILLFAGWHMIFVFLLLFALAMLVWSGMRLPESHRVENRHDLSVRWLVDAFLEVVGTRQTLGYALATGTIYGSLVGYISSAQQIFTEVYRVGGWFPVLFGAVAFSISIASLINSRLVMAVGMRRMAHGALVTFTAIGLVHAGHDLLAGTAPLWLFMVLMALNLCAFGLIMPNFNALAMEPMGRIAGTASSFIGAIMSVVGALLGWLVGRLFDGGTLPLALGFGGYGVLALLIVLVTERGRLFSTGPSSAH